MNKKIHNRVFVIMFSFMLMVTSVLSLNNIDAKASVGAGTHTVDYVENPQTTSVSSVNTNHGYMYTTLSEDEKKVYDIIYNLVQMPYLEGVGYTDCKHYPTDLTYGQLDAVFGKDLRGCRPGGLSFSVS